MNKANNNPEGLKHEIYQWLESYITDKEEARGVAGNIYYLVIQHSKKVFAIGMILGALATGLLVKWLS
jgi:hypothetical protein